MEGSQGFSVFCMVYFCGDISLDLKKSFFLCVFRLPHIQSGRFCSDIGSTQTVCVYVMFKKITIINKLRVYGGSSSRELDKLDLNGQIVLGRLTNTATVLRSQAIEVHLSLTFHSRPFSNNPRAYRTPRAAGNELHPTLTCVYDGARRLRYPSPILSIFCIIFSALKNVFSFLNSNYIGVGKLLLRFFEDILLSRMNSNGT